MGTRQAPLTCGCVITEIEDPAYPLGRAYVIEGCATHAEAGVVSNASLNAAQALHLVCDALSPYNFDSIEWRRTGDVSVHVPSPEMRQAIADRLGLDAHRIVGNGFVACAEGMWADIPVSVWSGPSYDEINAWALARAAS